MTLGMTQKLQENLQEVYYDNWNSSSILDRLKAYSARTTIRAIDVMAISYIPLFITYLYICNHKEN